MEIIVVLLVIVLFAALIAPNLVSMRQGQRTRAAYGQVTDLISEARTDAVNGSLTYAITWDASSSAFNLKKEPDSQNTANGSTIPVPEPRPLQTATTADSFDLVKSLTLPTGLQIESFRQGANNTDAGSWAMHFYPDGTCDGGGFVIRSGNDTQAVLIDKYGLSTQIAGALPDPTDKVWTAGTYAQKI